MISVITTSSFDQIRNHLIHTPDVASWYFVAPPDCKLYMYYPWNLSNQWLEVDRVFEVKGPTRILISFIIHNNRCLMEQESNKLMNWKIESAVVFDPNKAYDRAMSIL